jgi:hypothetical protein
MTHATPARSRKPKPPKFSPIFTEDQVFQIEVEHSESWRIKRRFVLLLLSRSPDQLAENFSELDDEIFNEMLGHFDDFKNYCKAGIELAEIATARLLAVGLYVAESKEGVSA